MTEEAATAALFKVYEIVARGIDLKGNYKRLRQEAKKLKAIRDAIETEISKDRITPATREWIAKVKMIESEVKELKTKYKNEMGHPWRLVRIWAYARLSTDVAEKYNQVHSLWEEGNLKREELDAELPEPVRKRHAPRIEENSALHMAVQEILSFLEDEQIQRIGVWGTVGTGKTTIMQNLNNHEQIAKMFDIVIWVTVSKEWSIEKLQDAIMRRLKLDMERFADIEENARRISEELKEKKYLVLLDEVQENIDLNAVMGIPNNQDSKVVLASRNRCVCYEMEADELINVKRLSPADAWNMFQEKVGHPISSPLIKPIAEQVVKECDGLPLLIDRIGRTFRKKGKDVSLWRDGLNRLRRWESVKTEGMDEVLDFLKFCYEELDGNKKDCFLYGALYPEECEIYIDYLLECWNAEGLIHDADELVDNTNVFRDARDKGHAILDALIDVSLLERSDEKKCVKMNKVLRKMALKISSQSNGSKFLVKPCEGLQDFPDRKEWEDASRISLMGNQLCTLPEFLHCHNLSTLLLQMNNGLIAIPEFFFESMRSLRVLDLHGTGIESLPSSISYLICLRGLYLNSCPHLIQLPPNMRALEQLEVLDIRGTKLNLLQIGSLIWLKCLRISLSSFFRGIRTQRQLGSISAFVSLEEFCVDDDLSEQCWDEFLMIVMEEVVTLKKLTSLRFCFPTVDFLKLFVQRSPVWKKNSCFTFQFCVGYQGNTYSQILESSDYPSYNCLKLVNGEGMHPVIAEVLRMTHAFKLINHKGVSTLSDFGVNNMENMLVCSVEGCNEIRTIVCGDRMASSVLENLEVLNINSVLKLRSIWQGSIPNGSLAQLTTLTLTKCPELKKIFSNGMIQQLPELQHLRVEECNRIEEIIMESENLELEVNALPRLKTLVLIDLPRLRSIWIDDSLEWPSLQRIQIATCHMLKRLPFSNTNALKLRFIEGQQSWWEALVWEDDALKQNLHSICILS